MNKSLAEKKCRQKEIWTDLEEGIEMQPDKQIAILSDGLIDRDTYSKNIDVKKNKQKI